MQIWPGPSMQVGDSQEGKIAHYTEYGVRTAASMNLQEAQEYYI